ncbi:hypothetical protein [Streptomyces sp. NPDC056255]
MTARSTCPPWPVSDQLTITLGSKTPATGTDLFPPERIARVG